MQWITQTTMDDIASKRFQIFSYNLYRITEDIEWHIHCHVS